MGELKRDILAQALKDSAAVKAMSQRERDVLAAEYEHLTGRRMEPLRAGRLRERK